MATAAVVYVVDDEEPICDSVALLLKSVGIDARAYTDPKKFLAEFDSTVGGCLIVDVRMPGMSGLEVQHELNRRNSTLPIIFITGHGDVPMAVEAMRSGARDFLQKPFKDDDLIRRVQKALEQNARDRDLLRQREEIRRRWQELTPRERDVAERIADGKANKVVAAECGISERTVELHRAHSAEDGRALGGATGATDAGHPQRPGGRTAREVRCPAQALVQGLLKNSVRPERSRAAAKSKGRNCLIHRVSTSQHFVLLRSTRTGSVVFQQAV